jgi:hypothetical protein
MAGCGTAARSLLPGVELIGVEPSGGDDTKRSLAAGERIRIPVPRTIADGLQVDTPGALTFEVNRRQVDEVLLVDDEAIVETIALLFERLKTVVEPSGRCRGRLCLSTHGTALHVASMTSLPLQEKRQFPHAPLPILVEHEGGRGRPAVARRFQRGAHAGRGPAPRPPGRADGVGIARL